MKLIKYIFMLSILFPCIFCKNQTELPLPGSCENIVCTREYNPVYATEISCNNGELIILKENQYVRASNPCELKYHADEFHKICADMYGDNIYAVSIKFKKINCRCGVRK